MTAETTTKSSAPAAPPAPEMVHMTIDGLPVEVEKGTLLIRAAEQVGVRIPRFCDHPLLAPSANCRQCLVEVAMPGRDGVVRPMPKPQPSCAMTAMEGMEISTQATSEVAAKAQAGTMEFLLINHPLDCPVCDKGGECPLQNQALELMASGAQSATRFTDVKRTFPKPLRLTSNILLDRDRCILCQRCVRFADQVAGDPFIALQGRGAGHVGGEITGGLYSEQIGRFDSTVLDFHDPGLPDSGLTTIRGEAGLAPEADLAGPDGGPGVVDGRAYGPAEAELDVSGRPFASYFSGNIIQICPVGALTSARYRFRARPVDLVSTDSVTEHDASGSAIRVDMRRGVVLRRLAGNDPEVNEEWITDKDRFAFEWDGQDRLRTPLVREDGELVPTSWSDALDRARKGLEAAPSAGFLPGGRLTFEDAWAWSKFARTVLGSDNIDFRSREATEEERSFLASTVAGSGLGVTYSDLERAGQVLLVALEPEDECGALFLRLRKGVRHGGTRVATVAPYTSTGSKKLSAAVLRSAPGTEPAVVESIAPGGQNAALFDALSGGVVLVGERAARTPGLLTAVRALAQRSGARLAWVPRRAGDRAALEAGLLPGLAPFGRPLAGAAATGLDWEGAPSERGLDADGMLAAAARGELGALVVGGVDVRDFADPDAVRAAIAAAPFVVSLEVRSSEVTRLADVVLPVAPPIEKNGTFINWEGRLRPFGQAVSARSLTDRDVLVRLAEEFDADLGITALSDLYAEANPLMDWEGAREAFAPVGARPLPGVGEGQAVLAAHKPMLDAGRLQDGAPWLAGAARTPVVRASAATLAAVGAADGQPLTITTGRGSLTLPAVADDLPDRVVWVPECSSGSIVHESLGAPGAVVTLSASQEVAR